MNSADGLSTNSTTSKCTSGSRLSASALTLTPEETKIIRMAKSQFERRGGFVRIFPTVDCWTKYSQYLGKLKCFMYKFICFYTPKIYL